MHWIKLFHIFDSIVVTFTAEHKVNASGNVPKNCQAPDLGQFQCSTLTVRLGPQKNPSTYIKPNLTSTSFVPLTLLNTGSFLLRVGK